MHRVVCTGIMVGLLAGCGGDDCRTLRGSLYWEDVEACAEQVRTIEGSLSLGGDAPAVVSLPALEEVTGTLSVYGDGVRELDVPLLHTARSVDLFGTLSELRLPSLRSASLFATAAEGLERIHAPELAEAREVTLNHNAELREVALPSLAKVGEFELFEAHHERSPEPLELDLSALEEVELSFAITGTATLRELRLPSLRRCLSFQLLANDELNELSFGEPLPELERFSLADNPLLSQCTVDEIEASNPLGCIRCQGNGSCD